MSDVTMEQKMRLIRQVRSRYHENRYDLYDRERILYGKTSALPRRRDSSYGEPEGDYEDYYEENAPGGETSLFFRIRLWVALFLLTAVIVMDRNDIKVAGITVEQIYAAISADYEDALEAWVEKVSQKSP